MKMSSPSVSDILSDHVSLEVECIHATYLNVYMPLRQTPGGISYLFRKMGPHTQAERRAAAVDRDLTSPPCGARAAMSRYGSTVNVIVRAVPVVGVAVSVWTPGAGKVQLDQV